jgi:hypothetical protein
MIILWVACYELVNGLEIGGCAAGSLQDLGPRCSERFGLLDDLGRVSTYSARRSELSLRFSISCLRRQSLSGAIPLVRHPPFAGGRGQLCAGASAWCKLPN